MRSVLLALALGFASVSQAQVSGNHFVDSKGQHWLRMDQSLRIPVSALDAACTPVCSGKIGTLNLSGYTWASQEQVLELMREFDPAAPAGGQVQFFTAGSFASALGITYTMNFTYSMNEGISAVTSSKTPNGYPILGSAYYGHAMVSIDGEFQFSPVTVDAPASRGVWLFRSSMPAAPASCSINGQTIAHGASVTLFQSASVVFGQQCASQVRMCDNGVLSGSYTSVTCSIQAPAPVQVPAPAPVQTPTPVQTQVPAARSGCDSLPKAQKLACKAQLKANKSKSKN